MIKISWFNIIKLFGEDDDVPSTMPGEAIDTEGMPNIEDHCCSQAREQVMEIFEAAGAEQDFIDDIPVMPCKELKMHVDFFARNSPSSKHPKGNLRQLFIDVKNEWDKCNRKTQAELAIQRRKINEGLP